ncbi:MAG: DUF2970 domain-containing protein [Janthinobacterium lividum]
MDEPARTAWHTDFRRSVSAVLWSFLGIRKGRDQARDFAQLKPLHVAIAAVACAAALITALVVLVHVVISMTSATS